MLIKEFVLGRPHPSTAHAEKCKLNVVLYVTRDPRSVTQSMHQLLKRFPHSSLSSVLDTELIKVQQDSTRQEMSINVCIERLKHALAQCTELPY